LARFLGNRASNFTGILCRIHPQVSSPDSVLWFELEIEMADKPKSDDSASQATDHTSAFPGDQEIYQQLFEFAPDGIVVVSMDGLIRRVNSQVEKLFGYSRDGLIGKPIETLIPERFAVQHIEHRSKYLGGPRLRPMGASLELFARRKDGTEFPVDIMLSHLETKDGGLALAVVRDATDRKKLEGNYRQARDVAEDASRAKDQFIAVLSHELRTPLTPVLTAVQMMETEPGLTAELRELTSIIRRNVQLEARLIDDLLDVTKIIRGKLDLQLEAVDLNVIVRQATKICESDIWSKQLRLTGTFEAKDHWVRADATRLHQILWNLLKNAVKFTPVGGAISIRTENLPDGRVSMMISDSGFGIEPEMLPCIFDAFAQGGSGTTRQFGGLGLGLAIAKGLVEMHGGTLTATSEGRNRGATFTLVLPTSPVTKSAVNQTGVGDAKESGQKSCRLLLVDDNEDTTAIFAIMFSRNGYSVRVADCVASAIQAAELEPFDLLISDIGLPDGSGLDLMAQLSSKVPIKGIVLSGHGMEDDVRRSKAAGFALHLTKPVGMKVLLQAVREVASSSKASSDY
jgi:PAS domain S-box-containing protein